MQIDARERLIGGELFARADKFNNLVTMASARVGVAGCLVAKLLCKCPLSFDSL